jgi:exportin-7
VEETKTFLEKGTSAHYLLGLRILNTLVQEMNLTTPGRTLTQQRKTAINFRDSCLFKVFQLSLYSLQEMFQKGADNRLKEQVLQANQVTRLQSEELCNDSFS